jgi:predicted molibdopterin-dependent oxidoreductase YjgC
LSCSRAQQRDRCEDCCENQRPARHARRRGAPPGGKNGLEILEAAAAGAIHALLIAGPTAALEASGEILDRALKRAESVIVIATRPGIVAASATVLIPGHAIFEKLGTVTNLEGRVQRVRPAQPPATQAPAETRVLAALAAELGAAGWDRGDPMSVNRALRAEVPASAPTGWGRSACFSPRRTP